jgi:hypothetical protein
MVAADDGEAGFGERLLAGLDVVALEPDDERELEADSRTASTMPVAITLQSMMPPKMFTRMPFTFGSVRMILNAAVTWSLEAPPPTSRKLAGLPPKCLMMSIVLIARPAPFTRQAMLPSSAM